MNTPNDIQQAFVDTFQSFNGRHTRWQIFSDFVELSALALSNSCDIRQFAEREKRYLEIIKRYDAPEDTNRFPELFGQTALAFAKSGPHDFLGELFGGKHLDLGNKHMGQFFTPYHVSLMMAKMTLHDCKSLVEKNDFFTMLEPASGSGGMVAAAAQAVEEEGLDYRQVMHVTAIDLDLRCTHMTYLTCCLLDIPAIVYNGNSLSKEPMRSRWVTPAHVRGGWSQKLADMRERDDAAALTMELSKVPLFAAAADTVEA